MLFVVTRVLCKQTKNPPKRVVPIDQNPLARWSRKLPRWTQIVPSMPHTAVGLEGCHSAFNATSSIRTCLFFGTAAPPCFLSVARWNDIEHVQVRPDNGTTVPATGVEDNNLTDAAERHFQGADMRSLAHFGEDAFLSPTDASGSPLNDLPPIVAIENFTNRSESIFRQRFPHGGWRMVVGHENWGVRSEFLYGVCQEGDQRPRLSPTVPVSPSVLKAQSVLYVPQYGTISSLNVVTSLGIALFYAFLDACFPNARTLVTDIVDDATDAHTALSGMFTVADLVHYQRQFTNALPTPQPHTNGLADSAADDTAGTSPWSSGEESLTAKSPEVHRNRSPRVDARPIHPLYYHGDKTAIRQGHHNHREALLAFSQAGRTPRRHGFGLSVLYENEFDQRNFGGLVRNANGFLVDHIFYVGRRKYNVVGAVGSNHYTPPEYLGPCCECDADAETEAQWSHRLREQVEAITGHTPPLRWVLLDIGHDRLYADGGSIVRDTYQSPQHNHEDGARHSFYSSPASLQWYRDRCADPTNIVSLCESEDVLAAMAEDGVLLVVPQEGKLPHMGVLRQCEKILRVTPASHYRSPAGLPSQVGSGIALQRLSVIMHPRVRLLS